MRGEVSPASADSPAGVAWPLLPSPALARKLLKKRWPNPVSIQIAHVRCPSDPSQATPHASYEDSQAEPGTEHIRFWCSSH